MYINAPNISKTLIILTNEQVAPNLNIQIQIINHGHK